MKNFTLNGIEYKMTGLLIAAIQYREKMPSLRTENLILTSADTSAFHPITVETYDIISSAVKAEYQDSF